MATAGMDELPEYDIVVQKGTEFRLPVTIEDDSGPVDLTGFSFKASLLAAPEAATALLEFDVQVVAAASGSLRLYASASSTALIGAVTGLGYKDAVPPNKFYAGYYTLLGAPSAATATQDTCYLQGIVKVYPRGTRR